MLFRKSLHTLEGVIAEIGGGQIQIDDVLLVDFLRHLRSRMAAAVGASPDSREFATRLSNFDLTRTSVGIIRR